MPVRILIADDHEVVRQGVRKILAARPEWEICGEATNGQEAIKLAGELQPDAIIMDITMPVMSGLEAARKLTSSRNSAPILIFTMHESRSLGDSVKEVGARGSWIHVASGARFDQSAGDTAAGRHVFWSRR